ncbi:MAG TPA: hypothetical protein VM598_11575 [Bdellovibrionota bacterium]|nr:hypothetical protein [Bdellovibrionota bacterium]
MKLHFLRALILLTVLMPMFRLQAADTAIHFIVNKDNPVTSLSAHDVADFFLKKQTRWPDGTPVRFIDWKEGSPVRVTFLERIVGKSSREVELYWIGQKLYTGDSAPVKVTSDALVVRFVSRFKGAIGFVGNPEAANFPGVRRIDVQK